MVAYGDFKDLNRRAAADKVLCDKAFNTATNLKYDGYQRGINSIVETFLNKIKNETNRKLENRKLAEELLETNQLLENLRKEKYTHFYRQYSRN